MLTIGENLNVINKGIGQAFKEKDPKPVREMAEKLAAAKVDFIDVNLGPARKGGEELMAWVVKTIQEVSQHPPGPGYLQHRRHRSGAQGP